MKKAAHGRPIAGSGAKARVPSAGKILKSSTMSSGISGLPSGGYSKRSNMALAGIELGEMSLHGLKKANRIPHKLQPLGHKAKKKVQALVTSLGEVEAGMAK